MVVASGCWIHNANFNRNPSDSNNLISSINNGIAMTAKGVLICRENSHTFQERTLNLERPVKIGRSVARARSALNNAIFDCKVLSRNHALLWYSAGKFYLQDTSSSNGTFVNNQRLSATGLESAPREVCSGDIVQFGVDVMETTKKVTHGCIVATLKLYLPDGKEAKASRSMSVASPADDVSLEDLYKLNQFVQEASKREKALHGKLAHLTKLVENTRKATDESWKALIDEDRLLARVKTVESQLVACSKNLTDDTIRNELMKLEEEKAQYQIAAKEALQKIHQEKLEVTQKLVQLESRLNETEEECQSLHDVSKHAQIELQELAAKYTEAQRNLQFMENKLVEKEEIVKWAMQEKHDLLKKVEEQALVERYQSARLRNRWLEDPVNIPKHITAMRNYMQTLVDMNPKLMAEEEDDTPKDAVNPIEAINGILNKLDGMLVENDTEIADTNLSNSELDQSQIKTQEIDSNQMIITNSEEQPFDKNELDDSPNKRENNSYIMRLYTLANQQQRCNDVTRIEEQRSSARRTLVNGGTNLDDSVESDGTSESVDDVSSNASDDTFSISTDETGEKSVIEMNVREIKNNDEFLPVREVRFAIGTNGKDLEEVHYDHSYRPEEEFADVANATGDDDSSDSIESPNNSWTVSNIVGNEDIEKGKALEMDEECEGEHLEGDYIKTLKPMSNSIDQSCSHTRDYILRILINSLESLRGEDDLEAQQVVKRELDELRDWLIQESSENIVNKLKELYYRAKNENQRIQEVNEELVILKEKYNVLNEEKSELLKEYKTLKAQCGDLLNTSYSVPIQYVAPIAVALVWMLLEKMF